VAARESVDADSAGRGGALGCQTRDGLGRLGDAFRDVAVTLAPGQVSAPTTADFGTFLVQATDVRVRPFEEVRATVRAQVLEPVQDRYEQLLRRLRREADVSVASRFGTWDRTNLDAITIVPPGGRPSTTAATTTTTPAPPPAGRIP
jgi:parvulin-like peptidyl-prolyl isomerase